MICTNKGTPDPPAPVPRLDANENQSQFPLLRLPLIMIDHLLMRITLNINNKSFMILIRNNNPRSSFVLSNLYVTSTLRPLKRCYSTSEAFALSCPIPCPSTASPYISPVCPAFVLPTSSVCSAFVLLTFYPFGSSLVSSRCSSFVPLNFFSEPNPSSFVPRARKSVCPRAT